MWSQLAALYKSFHTFTFQIRLKKSEQKTCLARWLRSVNPTTSIQTTERQSHDLNPNNLQTQFEGAHL